MASVVEKLINQVSENSIDIGLLRDLILNAIQIKDNLFIRGAPGIGKSEVVRQVASEINQIMMNKLPRDQWFKDKKGNDCCFELIEIRLALYDPSDISGIPSFVQDEYGVTRSKFSLPMEFPTNPKWKGIIFLDEMDQAQPAVLNACYKMIQEKMINDWHFPEETTFIAAGNGNFCEGYQNEIPMALKNRFTNVVVEGNLDKWIVWALKNDIEQSVISFLKSQHPEYYIDIDAMNRGEDSFATPRGWEMVSKILKSKASDDIKKIHINGRIGFTVGTAFWSYYKKKRNLPNFQDILDGIIDINDNSLDIFYSSIIGCIATIIRETDNESRKSYISNLSKSLNKLTKNENVVFATKLIYSMCKISDTDNSDFLKLIERTNNAYSKINR